MNETKKFLCLLAISFDNCKVPEKKGEKKEGKNHRRLDFVEYPSTTTQSMKI